MRILAPNLVHLWALQAEVTRGRRVLQVDFEGQLDPPPPWLLRLGSRVFVLFAGCHNTLASPDFLPILRPGVQARREGRWTRLEIARVIESQITHEQRPRHPDLWSGSIALELT